MEGLKAYSRGYMASNESCAYVMGRNDSSWGNLIASHPCWMLYGDKANENPVSRRFDLEG